MAIEASLVQDFRQMAEIAATMAGFAAVVGAIDRRGPSGQSAVQASTLVILLSATLPVIVLALLPNWLTHTFDSPDTVWRICFAAFAFVQVTAFGVYFRTGITKELTRPHALWQLILIPPGLTVTVIGIACTLGFFTEYYAVLYEGSLLFLLLVACVSFGYLLSIARHKTNA